MRLDSLIFEHRDALSLERRQDSTDTNGVVVVVDTRDVGLHPLTGADPKRVNRDGANCTPNEMARKQQAVLQSLQLRSHNR